jgi:magnesium chelatase family protein
MSTAGQRRALGRYGESVAARRLVADGMVLLDRNWRCELGEIDLVLRDGPVLVVCEVKTRSSDDFGSPLEAVRPAKAEPAPSAGRPVARGPRRAGRRGPDRPGRRAPGRARRSRRRPRAGSRLMPWATAHTVSLEGAVGHVIDVQVDVSHGLVNTALVGRPDVSISEARDRCRAAVQNCQLEWPVTKRVTILLSPADLPKRGPHFDLAMAVGVLSATGVIPRDALDGVVLVGELTLDGRLRAVPGVLPMVMAAAKRGMRSVVVPEPQADEAAMVPGMTVFGVRSLPQVVALLTGAEEIPEAPEVPPLSGQPLLSWRGEERLGDVDLADVRGMADARFAVEVAAAGGHHLLLSGPKGAGKTTLAERLPGLLPDLTLEESLELTAIHSLAGTFPPGAQMIVRPPFRAPHHSATRASLLGGGSGRVRPAR